MTRWLTWITLFAIAAALPAQVDPDGEPDPDREPGGIERYDGEPVLVERPGRDPVWVTWDRKGNKTEKPLTSEQLRDWRLRKAGFVFDGSTFYIVSVHTKPRRLVAGGKGEVEVLLQLKGNAVVLPHSLCELRVNPSQGLLRLGAARLRPAEKASVSDAFRGQKVHDNFVLLRLPVTVSPGAKPGRLPFAAELRVELHDGKNGKRLGKARTPVQADVVVSAKPVPTPKPTTQEGVPSVSTAPQSRPALSDPNLPVGPPPAGEDESVSGLWMRLGALLLAGGIVFVVRRANRPPQTTTD